MFRKRLKIVNLTQSDAGGQKIMHRNFAKKGLTIKILVLFESVIIFNLCVSGYQDVKHENDGISEIIYHLATQKEIDEMKENWGVYDSNKNYNNIAPDGHGTGLCPPTEDEWDEMIGKLKIVDNISYPGGEGQRSSFDHMGSPFFPKIGDQGSQDSCAAWATTYYQHGYYQALDNNWNDAYTGNPNHLMSPAWTYNKANHGENGKSSFYGNWNVLRTVGCAKESTMPYNENDHVSWGSEAAWRSAPEFRCADYDSYYYSTKMFNTINIKNALLIGRTPFMMMNGNDLYSGVSWSWDDTITSGDIFNPADHALTIVGYDDSKEAGGEVGAFKVVNSWGEEWNEVGYFWMTYYAFIQYGNQYNYDVYWFDDSPDYEPSLLGVWQLNPQCDRDASISLGIGTYGSPLDIRLPVWDGHSEVMHSYPEFMCLDITEFYEEWASGVSDFYLEIGDAVGNDGTITSFKVEYYGGVYIPDSPSRLSPESPDTPLDTPGYVTVSFLSPQNVVYVDDDYNSSTPGWSIDHFDSIQDGVDVSDVNGNVYVYNGTYHENVIIHKSIKLIGEDRTNTIIDAGGIGDVIQISADLVNISGFSMINGGSSTWDDAGLDISHSSYCIVENCLFFNNLFAGIRLDSVSNCKIINCESYDNGHNGIYTRSSSDVQILDCVVYNNPSNGMRIEHSSNNFIIDNCMISNNGGGIQLLQSANNNIIVNCSFFNNSAYGIQLHESANNNLIYHCNLFNNTQNVFCDESSNCWYNATLEEGNYYDDYNGEDNNGDGIGDTPYDITGGVNQDLYPLIHPYGSVTNLDTSEVFITIQDAIDDSDTLAGHTIFVKNGTYYENIVINKTINLIGEDKNTTIIDFSWENEASNAVVKITANWVDMSGFMIRGGDSWGNADKGLILYCNHSNIYDNIIDLHSDIHIGIELDYSNNNTLSKNIVKDNGDGFRLFKSNDNVLSENIVDNIDSMGIYLYRSHRNTLSRNIIQNSWQGITVVGGTPSNNNLIFHNNFINTNNAYDECINTWYNTTLQEGNYWSNFDEPDEGAWDNDSDGIIDVPYPIPGGSNYDMYPLVGNINLPPVSDASAGEPYTGFVGEEIIFNGSLSYDPDGYITSWVWDFDDDTNGSGEITLHTFSNPGIYAVILTVTDNENTTDSYDTTALIIVPNRPPSTPELDGPAVGIRNIEYTYTVVSTDADNDTVQYIFDWGDENMSTSEFLPSGTPFSINHSWSVAGEYIISVYAYDNMASSDSTDMLMSIYNESFSQMGIIPSSDTIYLGEDFTILVYIDPIEPIGGWQIHEFNFTQGIVNADEVTPGSYWAVSFDNGTIDNDVGMITNIQTWTTGPYPDINHTACMINFTALQPGICTFEIVSVQVSDSGFEEIIVVTREASVIINRPPLVFNEYPANGSVDVERPPLELNVTIEDPDGDIMDLCIEWNTSYGETIWFQCIRGIINGTYNVTTDVDYFGNDIIWGNTTYYWSVWLSDGKSTVTKKFQYTTGGSRYDVSNNDLVNFQDAGLVWVHRTSEVQYDGIYDVNQDGQVNFQDAGLTWVNRD